MAIDFPAAPVLNEIFVSGGKSWVYDGTKWIVSPASFTDVSAISTPNYIAFDTTPTGVPVTPGVMAWNPDDLTFDLSLPRSVLQVGMEMYLPPVNNNSGVTIPNGAFVMATGVQGDRITVAKAVTNGTVDPMYMVGISTSEIINGETDGTITVNGIVRDIDTAAWPVGTILYPDPLVAGGLTSTQPDAPAIRTPIAIVLRQHENTGRILVRMTNGSVLGGTDSNVHFESLADRDIIEYNASSGIWSNTDTPRFTSVDLNSNAHMTANLQNISVITPVQFDSWNATVYRSAEYILQFTQGTNYSVTKLLVVQNGTDAAITEYGHVEVGTSIDFVIGTGFSLGSLELTVTCSTANATPVSLQFSRILFEA